MTPQQEARIAEAIRHVEMGFAVMSVWSTEPDGTCKCQKPHADPKSRGKHPIPRDGFKAATRDIGRVKAMLSAGSEPNYGIVWPEGDDVVFEWDVDGADWKQRIEELKATYGPLPPTKTTRSPSGGLHVFYRWPKGYPVPEGNHFHGFVVRWPWKGYVVGPGSRINGTQYTDVGAPEIATLPPSWAVTAPTVASDRPLIVVAGTDGGYELPKSVATGGRHDAIAAFVASRWNRGITKAEIAVSVRAVLVPLFDEIMDDHRLSEEIEHAWDTCVRKWKEPTSVDEVTVSVTPSAPTAPTTPTTSGQTAETESPDQIVIDPLLIETRIEQVKTLDLAGTGGVGLAMLLDHFTHLTDAPPSSLALASCVVMSALAGTSPTLGWRGKHRAALFGVLVGHSGYGRKGATMREVEAAFMQADPLLREIEVSGIGSGEVLVDILNESKQNTIGTSLIWEHEIANVLILASREGNIMSGNLRRAWDGDAVQSRSRAKGKSEATGYNVAFMGGVTPSELEKRLTANDIANGWANRFLWFHSEKRPGGYDPTADQTLPAPILGYLRDCIDFARRLGGSMLIKPMYTMRLSPDALARMEAMATALDVPPVGALGALQQRMPAHVIRLAMVAALFDQTNEVDEVHVEFGERMTAYAIASMRSVFGIRVDDPVAMHILDILSQVPGGWLNTGDLRKATGKDHPRTKAALRVLQREGLVVEEQRSTGGRPAIGYTRRA